MTRPKGQIRGASISVEHLHYLGVLYLRRRMKIRIWQKIQPRRRVKLYNSCDKSNKNGVEIKHMKEQKYSKKT